MNHWSRWLRVSKNNGIDGEGLSDGELTPLEMTTTSNRSFARSSSQTNFPILPTAARAMVWREVAMMSRASACNCWMLVNLTESEANQSNGLEEGARCILINCSRGHGDSSAVDGLQERNGVSGG